VSLKFMAHSLPEHSAISVTVSKSSCWQQQQQQ
jgi:hypothetical protein